MFGNASAWAHCNGPYVRDGRRHFLRGCDFMMVSFFLFLRITFFFLAVVPMMMIPRSLLRAAFWTVLLGGAAPVLPDWVPAEGADSNSGAASALAAKAASLLRSPPLPFLLSELIATSSVHRATVVDGLQAEGGLPMEKHAVPPQDRGLLSRERYISRLQPTTASLSCVLVQERT
jgi:hypothetical protein